MGAFLKCLIIPCVRTVNRDVDAETKLVDFLRRKAVLTGTKWMCRLYNVIARLLTTLRVLNETANST